MLEIAEVLEGGGNSAQAADQSLQACVTCYRSPANGR